MQLAHPKVAQPKLGAYSAPSLLLVSSTHPARMPDGPAKKPGGVPFYRECRHALKVLSRLQTGLSDSRPLLSRALYRCLVSRAACDILIGELGVTEAEGRLLWPWAPRMRCLNNDEASLTWLVIRNALWIGKKLFAAQQAISPECGRCGDLEETIGHAFFHCPVVRPLCKLLEGYMVRILNGKFFVLEASSVCSNVVPKLNRQGHYVFLCLLWTTRKKELFEDESFSSQTLVAFFKHQIKVKIRSERKRLSSLGFGERWVTCALVSRGRSQPYFQLRHPRDIRILSYRKDMTTQPR